MKVLSKSSRVIIAIVGLAIGYGVAQGNDVYIAPSATGSANGSSCTNALAVTYFNAAGNWTSGTPSGSLIGPGSAVHLCSGTYTFSAGTSCGLSFQGSGTSGSPIALVADQGAATITAPYWAGSANGGPICSSGYNFVTINGDNNLTLQATANGSALANQADYGFCVWALTGNNVTIENLTCSNIYVHVQCVSPYSNCDEGGQNTGAIAAQGSNVTVTGNVIHDAKWCLTGGVGENVTIANRVISNNTVYNCDHGVAVGVSGNNGVLNGLSIYGNNICCAANWDDNPSVNNNHHDGIHVWSYNSGDLITGAEVYNNYIHGDWGASWNAAMFVEAMTGMPSAYYFNNVLVDQSSESHNGCGAMCFENNGISIFNNTIVGSGAAGGGSVAINNYGTGVIIENNTVVGAYGALNFTSGSTFAKVNYNNYYGIGSAGWNNGGSFSSWQSSCSCDSNSSTTNPSLSTTYGPSSSSSALLLQGTNLSGLNIAALDMDPSGVARPPLPANWTIGAYQSQSGSGSGSGAGSGSSPGSGSGLGSGSGSAAVLPPTNLSAVVQ